MGTIFLMQHTAKGPAQALLKRMAAFVDNSLLDVRERNSMAITLNIHTKSQTPFAVDLH